MHHKNLLVTDGAGFIGSHLVERLTLENSKKFEVIDKLFLGIRENLLRFPRKVTN